MFFGLVKVIQDFAEQIKFQQEHVKDQENNPVKDGIDGKRTPTDDGRRRVRVAAENMG